VVHANAFPCQQQLEPSPAEPAMLGRQLLQSRSRRSIIQPTMPIAHHAAIGTNDRTCPPLTDPVRLTRSGYRSSPSSGLTIFVT
jgi:hypothetical protein